MYKRPLQLHTMIRITNTNLSCSSSSSSLPLSLPPKLERCKTLQELKQIHAFTLKAKPNNPHLLHSKIITLSATFHNDLNYARSILSRLENPDVQLYNTLIQCCSRREFHKAIELYCEMLQKGVLPDGYTVPFVLKACGQVGALRIGEVVHGRAVKDGLVLNVYVVNTLMRLYAVCGVIESARKVFDESSERDLVSWTTLIQGYVKRGLAREGIKVFFDMCEVGMRADGMTLVIVLSACARLEDLSLGRKIHEYLVDNAVNSDVYVGNALIDMYLKCGDDEFACKVFNEMRVKDVVTWNSLISGLAQQGKFKEALDVFQRMQTVGVDPDDVTIVGVLNSCANLGVLELGKWVHAYIGKKKIRADGYIGNALVDMYTKCGSIDKAIRVFEGMKCRDVYSYTAMIVGLAMHGKAEKALSIFSEMHRIGVEPDEVTFVGVLSACSHAGLVEEGRMYFKEMSRVYNLKPQTEHYGCMVDLLGRAGLISEAVEFINNMPMEADASVWGALLSACKIHGKVELGERVMKKLMKIEPEKDGAYILMSNIYSSANRWRDAVKLRKAMKVRKMKKTPGCSSIEIDGVIHEFRKGDKSHPKIEEINVLLDHITCHLKNAKYSTQVGAIS